MVSVLQSGRRCGFVALIGQPNVGKSTLLNRLVGARIAIVSPKPQTTRTQILGIRTRGNTQLIFVDTPGIHGRRSTLLNKHMVRSALRSLEETDNVLFLVDAARGVTAGDERIANRLIEIGTPTLIGVNKIDLIPRAKLIPLLDRLGTLFPGKDVIPISALRGENIRELLETLTRDLPEGPALYPGDEVTDQSERVLAQEMVREQLFFHTQQEVPYSTAVAVDHFEEIPASRLLRIYGTIYVERSSQKAIVIGHKGAVLKAIGRSARQRMEAFFGCKIYLELFVKISKGWTNNPGMLRELGVGH